MSHERRDSPTPFRFPALPESPPCPFCGGRETELVSPFGGQLSVAQYWCRGCRTGFEQIKWRNANGE